MPLTRLVPFALYVGEHLILTDVNEKWRELYLGPVPLGVPAREIFTGRYAREFVERLAHAWKTGEIQYVPCLDHASTVVITPLIEAARVVGLVTGCGLERLGPMLASLPGLPAVPSLELSA